MKKRLISIDILRIMSMIGIITIHLIGRGGLLDYSFTPRYYLIYLVYIVSLASVNLFGIMSGYLSYDKTDTSYRFINLLFITFFYCLVFSIIYLSINQFKSDLSSILNNLIPAMDGKYWYITCFFPLLILEPFINNSLNKFSIHSLRKLVFIIVLFFSIMPSVFNVDFFVVNRGYSFLWLLCCYIIGVYLRREVFKIKRKGYIVGVIVSLLGVVLLLFLNLLIDKIKGNVGHNYMLGYNSPVLLFFAICVFIALKEVTIILKTNKAYNIVVCCSSLSFDAYIIHAHPFVISMFEGGAFLLTKNILITLSAIFIIPICVFFVAIIIGYIRSRLFVVLKINKLSLMISSKMSDKFIE